MPVSWAAMMQPLMLGMADLVSLSDEELAAKYPPRPTLEQERAARSILMRAIRLRGGTPWEVWEEGYKGMGSSVPHCWGVFEAPTFEGACAMANEKFDRAPNWGAPLHPSEEAAWAAFDTYWYTSRGIPIKPDPRRPTTRDMIFV